MLEPEIVRQIRELAAMSWGSKRIAATLGISRVAARRYLRGAAPGAQERPRARRLDADQRKVAVAVLDGEAAGNAVVARQLARRARDRRGAADAAAGGRAAPPSSARRRGGDGSLRDGARASAPDRLRRATRRHRWSRDARLLLRRRARLFAADLRAGVPAPATRRLARGPRRARSGTSAASRRRCSSTMPARWSSGATARPASCTFTLRSARSAPTGASRRAPAARIAHAPKARPSPASAT